MQSYIEDVPVCVTGWGFAEKYFLSRNIPNTNAHPNKGSNEITTVSPTGSRIGTFIMFVVQESGPPQFPCCAAGHYAIHTDEQPG